MLQRLHDVMVAKSEALIQATVEEYGAPVSVATMLTDLAIKNWLHAKEELQTFEFTKYIGKAKVVLEPLGVVGAITPWNADYTHMSGKLAPAIAMGCTVVIKPSELSAIQTQLFAECIHEAGIPAGVINIVNGTGEVVGAELTRHPDVAMIAFIGSTKVGKIISHGAVDTLKREIFGPVLSILTYKTEEEAVDIANDTIYGLSAYISSSNLEKANQVASQIVSGRVLINGLHNEPKAPFGGSKQSGIGRDHGAYGLEEYVEPKTILGYDVAEINLA
jgi:acyl-CoA reductase-like NAD-dependent aldehyde dehydrogenase